MTPCFILLALALTASTSPAVEKKCTTSCETLTQSAAVVDAQKASVRQVLSDSPETPRFGKEVRALYQSVDDRLVWTHGGRATEQTAAVTEALRSADQKGLVASDYDGANWADRLSQIDREGSSTAALARFDVALSEAAIHYVADLGGGRINPNLEHFETDRSAHRQDVVAHVVQLADAPDIAQQLTLIEPSFPAYQRDLQALQTYLALVPSDDGEKLAPLTRSVLPGDAYVGVAQLARRLRLFGDLSASAIVGTAYDAAIVLAVVHFQLRHGLPTDGVLDKATVRELNVPLARRITQLQLALERLRWLPREFASPPLIINIPEFRLHGDDTALKWVLSMKVVVRRAYRHQTPVFVADMREVIFRPDWNVPRDIESKELIPELEKNPQRLAAQDFDLVDRNGVPHALAANDETVQQLRAGELRFRQKPGASNALGLIKFVFPNSHDIYLHSTPTPLLFQKSRRDFSHGCIRVEEPDLLAAWVLQQNPEWTLDRIRAAMNGPTQITVKLAQAIPVLILYSTAVVMEDGDVHFFDDIYGHDKTLERSLTRRESPRQLAGSFLP